MNAAATFASTRPYESPPRVLLMSSRTAVAIAAVTTTMMMATMALGRNAITPVRSALMGFGPKTPKAIWSTNSSSV